MVESGICLLYFQKSFKEIKVHREKGSSEWNDTSESIRMKWHGEISSAFYLS